MRDNDFSCPVDSSFIRAAYCFLKSVRMVEPLEMIAHHCKKYDPTVHVRLEMMSFNKKIIAYELDSIQQNTITPRNDAY